VLLVLKVRRDRKATQVRRGQLELLVPLVLKAHKDRRALQVPLAQLDRKGQQE
jgi:hypothetical protein